MEQATETSSGGQFDKMGYSTELIYSDFHKDCTETLGMIGHGRWGPEGK